MTMTVQLQPDDEGYFGRECPACEKYFKVRLGTGLPDQPNCHCPYCGQLGDHNTFYTRQQNDEIAAAASNFVAGMFSDIMKASEPKPDPQALVSIGISVKGQPTPIASYPESKLEVRASCSACTLEYKIFGAFGYCPECGVHHSRQIVLANLRVATTMLDLAATAQEGARAALAGNALDVAVSAFDGFGSEHGQGRDMAAGMTPEESLFLRELMQKTGTSLPLGEPVAATDAEVRTVLLLLEAVVAKL